jgi:Flp pilus assembly protein TadG
VEFALISLPLIGILVAALQTGIIFFYDQALQTVTTTVARQIMTGQVQSQGLSQAQFQTLVCNAAASKFSCPGLMVDVQSATDFSILNTKPIKIIYDSNGSPTNTFSYAPGIKSSAVILRIMYDWPVIGIPFLANQSNGAFLMVGTAVFKTEPY